MLNFLSVMTAPSALENTRKVGNDMSLLTLQAFIKKSRK